MQWYCGHCSGWVPMTVGLDHYCTYCGRKRDFYSNPPPPPPRSSLFRGRSRQEGSTPYRAAPLGRSGGEVDISSARLASEGVSPKSASPTNSRYDKTPQETSLTLSEGPKHAHRPTEPGLSLEVPVVGAQDNRGQDKSAITADEISTRDDTHEQWIADDVLKDISKDISGDSKVSGDVPLSDPESDRDSLRGPLGEPSHGDRSSDDPNTSEQTRTKLSRRLLLSPVLSMLLVRVCGMVTRLFEPNPLPGRTRIRWRCECGRMLYDDFVEVRPGALADLEQSLNSTGGFYVCSPSTLDNTSYARSRPDSTSPGSWLGPLWWPWKSASVQSPSHPLHERQNALDRVSTQPPADSERQGLCIFMCIPHRASANRLGAWVVQKNHNDRSFFSSMRTLYKEVRESRISSLSLKTVKSIRFVRFEVNSKKLVDVRTTPDVPDESRRDEYSYHPMSADFLPPIAENHMMHLYTYPNEAKQTGICLSKIPKKTEGLAWLPVHPQGCKVGWGLQFVEGLDWMKLWIFGSMGSVISAMLGVAWAILKRDMQIGFEVAAWVLIDLIFTTGLIRAAYAPR